MQETLYHASLVAIFGMVLGLLPLGVAVAYMLRPSERLLALMRPLSLATIFAGLTTLLSGLAGLFRTLPKAQTASGYDVGWISHGLSETVTPMFVACSFLTLAWLCIAVGMRRQA
jgi:hypothetical protein